MKTIIKMIILASIILLGTAASYGLKNVENTSIHFSNEFTFKNVKKGYKLSLRNNTGRVIYSEIINYAGEYKSTYDFSSLKNGLYSVELIKDFEINIKPFAVNANQVTFLVNSEKTIYMPLFRFENYKMFISQLTLDKASKLKVNIYFENNLIYSETLTGNVILERIYNLKEAVTGKYKVEMDANGRTYKSCFTL
jgi:hypothetical protein